MPDDFGYQGLQRPSDATGDYNAQAFLIRSILSTEVRTCTLVQVVNVTNAGGVSPVGFCDVQPLVNQVDGDGRPTPHGIIYNLPYFRIQGGTDAVILDPKPGDFGIAMFADRDISGVKAAKAAANPGSARTFDMADGLYLGGVLNGVPQQYVRFYSGGVEIVSPTKIRLAAPTVQIDATTATINASGTINENSPTIVLNGALTQGLGSNGGTAHLSGPLTVDHDVTAQGTSTHTHVHGGVSSGGSNSGPPI